MTADASKPPPPDPDAPPPSSVWQRRVRDPIVAQLTQGVTPDKIALTIAVGIACGLFPCFGTWMLCLAAAFAFKLNHPVIQIVNQLLWPVHLLGVFFYAWLATNLFRLTPIPLHPEEIKHLLFNEPHEFVQRFGLLGICMFVVWLASVPLLVAGIYYPVRPLLRRFLGKREAGLQNTRPCDGL